MPTRRLATRLVAVLLAGAAAFGAVGCGRTAGDGKISPPSSTPK